MLKMLIEELRRQINSITEKDYFEVSFLVTMDDTEWIIVYTTIRKVAKPRDDYDYQKRYDVIHYVAQFSRMDLELAPIPLDKFCESILCDMLLKVEKTWGKQYRNGGHILCPG